MQLKFISRHFFISRTFSPPKTETLYLLNNNFPSPCCPVPGYDYSTFCVYELDLQCPLSHCLWSAAGFSCGKTSLCPPLFRVKWSVSRMLSECGGAGDLRGDDGNPGARSARESGSCWAAVGLQGAAERQNERAVRACGDACPGYVRGTTVRSDGRSRV